MMYGRWGGRMRRRGGEFEAGHLRHLDVGDDDVGSEAADESRASRPLALVATTVMSGSSSRSAERAPRTMVWSSASEDADGVVRGAHRATQEALGLGWSGLRELDEQEYAGVGGDGEAATEGFDALAHAAQAVAFAGVLEVRRRRR